MKAEIRKMKGKDCCTTIPSCDMEIGEIGIIAEGDYCDHIVLKSYDGLVSLTNPRKTWGGNCTIGVRYLKNNEEVVLS